MRAAVACLLVALMAPVVLAQRSAWVLGRTAWGDPDLQGVFTNSNEYATPLERPAAFKGKRLDQLSPEDLADARRVAEQQAIAGLAPGPRGPDYWWLENLDLAKRAKPWLVVDPPEGVIPPLTPEGQRRLKANPVRSSFLGGPFNGPEDLGLLERCITRGVPGSMIPVMYGNTYQIVQAPGHVLITYEIVHEARIIPLDGRPHVGPRLRTHMGDARGRWDGDVLVVETTNFTDAAAYRGVARRQPESDRALQAGCGRSHRVDGDDRRSRHLDAAVDDRHAPDARPASGDAVRVPRAQLRRGEHPEGRPRRGAAELVLVVSR